MKVIIAGTRTFSNYVFLRTTLYNLLTEGHILGMDTVVSGCAKGADKLGEKFAAEHNVKVVLFPALWEQHGKAAGPIRNIEMANYADALVAFWDGESRGTNHIINSMVERQKEVHIISIPKPNI